MAVVEALLVLLGFLSTILNVVGVIEANLGAAGNIIGSIPFIVSIVEAPLILLRLFSTVLNIMRVMMFMSTLLEQVFIEANLGAAGNIPFVVSVVEAFLILLRLFSSVLNTVTGRVMTFMSIGTSVNRSKPRGPW